MTQRQQTLFLNGSVAMEGNVSGRPAAGNDFSVRYDGATEELSFTLQNGGTQTVAAPGLGDAGLLTILARGRSGAPAILNGLSFDGTALSSVSPQFGTRDAGNGFSAFTISNLDTSDGWEVSGTAVIAGGSGEAPRFEIQASSTATLEDQLAGGEGTLFIFGRPLETTSSALTESIDVSSELRLTETGPVVLDTTLTGDGVLAKQGTGTLTFTGDGAAFAGLTRIEDGTFRLESGLGGDVDVASRLVFAQPGDARIEGALTGSGEIVSLAGGTLDFAGDGTGFSGTTRVDGGTLRLLSDLGGDYDVTSQLIFDQAGDVRFDGTLTGSGELVASTRGTLSIAGDATGFGGITRVEDGTLRLERDLGGDLNIATRAIFDQTGNSRFEGRLSGSGELISSAGGILTFAGDGTAFGGVTRVEEGVLVLERELGGDYDVASTLVFGQAGDVRFAGTLEGTGELVASTGGTLTFAGSGTDFAGVTRVQEGSLRLERDLGGDIDVSSQFIFAQPGDVQFTDALSGSGEVVSAVGGTLDFAGDGTGFFGTTRVDQGTLRLLRDLGGDFDIASRLIFDQAGDVRFEGTVTGAGELVAATGGTLNIAGDGTAFEGLTRVDSGVLRITGGLGGDYDVTSRIVFDQTDDIDIGGRLTGSGQLDIFTDGVATFSGDSDDFDGVARLGTGALRLDGPFGGRIVTAPGTRLTGSGSSQGLEVDGAISPGGPDAVGVIAVGAGGFRIGEDAVVELDVLSEGTDVISTSGEAVIDGGTLVIPSFEAMSRDGDVTIVSATGGVSGAFDRLVAPPALDVALEETYAADRVSLNLVQSDAAMQSPKGIYPETVAGAASLGPVFASEIRRQGASDASASPDASRVSAWMSGLEIGTGIERPDGELDVSVHGVTAGIGRQADLGGADAIIGLGFGQLRTDIELPGDAGSDSAIETTEVGGFVSLTTGPWQGSLAVSVGGADFKTARRFDDSAGNPRTARGNSDGRILGASIEVARDLGRPGGGLSATGLAGFDIVRVERDAFVEDGADASNLLVEGTGDTNAAVRGGVRIAAPGTLADRPAAFRAEAGLRHRLSEPEATTASELDRFAVEYETEAGAFERTSATIGVGFDWAVRRGASLTLRYDGRLGDGDMNHALALGLRARF